MTSSRATFTYRVWLHGAQDSLLNTLACLVRLKTFWQRLFEFTSLHFTPLAGRDAQFHEGMRVVAPKAGVWSFTLCTLTWTSTNHVIKSIRFTVYKSVLMELPEIWI